MFISTHEMLDLSPTQSALGLCTVVVILLLLSLTRSGSRRRNGVPLPPGPTPLPVLGNLTQMPRSHEWETYSEWASKYGNIIYLSMLGTPLVILNSYEVSVDLLEKRGGTNSDRPEFTMMILAGWEWGLTGTPYGDKFRARRRCLGQHLNSRAVQQYWHVHQKETNILLQNLLNTPDDFLLHLRRTPGASIMRMIYGYNVKPVGEDAFITLADAAAEVAINGVNPSSFLVNLLPFLKHLPEWMPGGGFHTTAKIWKKIITALLEVPYAQIKREMSEGKALPSISSSLIESHTEPDGRIVDDDIIKTSVAMAYVAGADTSVSVIETFVLMMVLHPDVQRTAQAELDRVLGNDHLPSLEDRDDCPYIEAILKEVHRTNPVVPVGVPHRSVRDDVYNGMFIPRGTMMITNIWAMLHDPAVYPDPDRFDPSRFVGPHPQRDPRLMSFGFGRRICPGRFLANDTTWLAIASILSAFDITKHIDPVSGAEMTPDPSPSPGFLNHPKPYKCSIKPRSTRVAEVVSALDTSR